MSDNVCLVPSEISEYAAVLAEKKAKLPQRRTFILAILAGMYIGFGGLLVVLVGAGTAELPYGLVKLLMGLVFSIGLILVAVGGGELFTGSTIVALAGIDKKISWSKVFKNWGLVYFGNFVGALILAILILLSKEYQLGGGIITESIMKIAASKLHYSFLAAVAMGILCNIFVCLGLWLSYSSRNTGDKILAIIFPITAFVALSFEHSVANMYLLSSAWLIKLFDPAAAALYSGASFITLYNIIVVNLIPVTIGNIIGGLFVWLMYRFAYKK
jgi:formate transporter